jgi:hypothetical protein
MDRFMNTLFQELTQEQRQEFEIIVGDDDFVLASWIESFIEMNKSKMVL